jgi:hypothetical protein
VLEQAASDAAAATIWVHPHPFDLARRLVEELDGSAGDRGPVESDDDEDAVRWGERGRVRDEGFAGVEPAREAGVELREVPLQRGDGVVGSRVDGVELEWW